MLRRATPALWLILGQGASSLGNVLLAVLIARESSVTEFALFALAMPFYIVLQRFTRVYLLIPEQVEFNRPDGLSQRKAPYAAATCLALILLCLGVPVLALVTFEVGASATIWFWLLMAAMPGLLLYDCVRNEALALSQMRKVTALDMTWLAGQLVLSAAVLIATLPVPWFFVAWALPPLVQVVVATPLVELTKIKRGIEVLWSSRCHLSDSLSDLFNSVLIVQAIPYIVLALTTLNAAGSLRAAQVLLGPVNVAVMGLLPLVQISVAQRSSLNKEALRVVHRYSLLLTVLAALYGAILVCVPDALGRELLGATWAGAAVMLPGLTLLVVLRTPGMAIVTAMRSMRMNRILVFQRLVSSALLVSGAVIGCLVGRLWVIPIGMAGGAGLSLVISYLALLRGMRRALTEMKTELAV